MYVAELWRYPVKSMAGERLREVNLTPLGLDGDRIVHVENARGRVVTARTHPKLLGHRRIGDVLIALADLRGRCVMTTFDPDTLAQDHRVLQSIVDRFRGRLALNGAVVRGGHVREGDRVELLEARRRSQHQ